MTKKKKVLNELPEELVEEILVKLPVKSLLRFSLVSKPWKSIISESRFVKRYRGRETNIVLSSSWNKFSYINRLENFAPSFNVSSLSTMTSSGVEEATSTGLVVFEFGNKPTILASCDELWLACPPDWTSFYLWNPSTRRHKKLPNPSILLPSYPNVNNEVQRNGFFHYGLGYDSVGDDYKILKYPGPLCGIQNQDRAELYSLRSDSWRDVLNFPRYLCLNVTSVFVSGKIHWLDSRRVIVSFDLSTENLVR